jgi:hypothetical protein
MPRYHFVIDAPHQVYDDADGTILAGPHTAKVHGHKIVDELKADGYHPADATLRVLDENGQTIHSIPF